MRSEVLPLLPRPGQRSGAPTRRVRDFLICRNGARLPVNWAKKRFLENRQKTTRVGCRIAYFGGLRNLLRGAVGAALDSVRVP